MHRYVLFVTYGVEFETNIFVVLIEHVDSCLVQNGGCDKNAECTHEKLTNAVVCICKVGYINNAEAPNVVCVGNYYYSSIECD